jgi:hypothetical protein
MPISPPEHQTILELFAMGFREVAPDKDGGSFRRDMLIADLGIDSLAMMQIVGIVEDATGVTLSDEEIARIRTIGDVERSFLAKRRSAR